MDAKLPHLVGLYGVAGAREKFEDLVAQLIHVERPDSERIRVHKGDAGIDCFEGSFTGPEGVDVYQMKYFPEKLGESQEDQIRKSFASVRNATAYKARSWTLCLPIDMNTDERKWFDSFTKNQKGSGIEIKPYWGALHIEGLLHQEKNRTLRESFFRQEHLELLRAQVGTLDKLLEEFRARVPVPVVGLPTVSLLRVSPKRAHTWHEDKVIVEVAFCFRVKNEGKKSVPKWDIGVEVDWADPAMEERLVTREMFPGLWRSGGYRLDSTLLSGKHMEEEIATGVWVRRSEPFGDTLQKTLNAMKVTFWAVNDDGPGEQKTAHLSEVIDWAKQMDGFRQAHLLGVSRLPFLE